MITNKKTGMLLILLAGLCWGIFTVFSRFVCAQGISAMQAASIRATVGAGCLLVIAVKSHAFRAIRIKDMGILFLIGLTSIFGMYLSYMTALTMLTTAMAAVLLYLSPAFVIVLSRICYQEKITYKKLICLFSTLLGCMLVVRMYDAEALQGSWMGIVFGILAALCYSMLPLLSQKLIGECRPDAVSIVPVLFGAVLLNFVAPVWQQPEGVEWTAFLIAACILMGVIGTAIPVLAYVKGMASGVHAGEASILATIEPVTAAVMGIVCFHDQIEWLQILGMLMVLFGVIYVGTGQKQKN